MTLKTESNEMNFKAWKCESSNQIDSKRFGFRSKLDIFHVWGGHNEPCSPRFNICPIYVRHYYGLIIIWWCYNHIWFPINPIWSEKTGSVPKTDQKGSESVMKLSEITMSETFFGRKCKYRNKLFWIGSRSEIDRLVQKCWNWQVEFYVKLMHDV